MLTFALLGFLKYAPMSGYDLKQVMDRSTTYFWYAKQSQIYTSLKKMVIDGSVTSKIEPQEHRPDRRVYSITKEGEKALYAWLSESQTEVGPRKEALLLKLFFSSPLGKETLLAQLNVQHELHLKQLELYRGETKEVIQKFASQMPDYPSDALLWEATRRFGENFEEMYVAWLEETMVMIESKFAAIGDSHA